jgi:hypothetical protein
MTTEAKVVDLITSKRTNLKRKSIEGATISEIGLSPSCK